MRPGIQKATLAAVALTLVAALATPPPAAADSGGAARTRSGGGSSGGGDGSRSGSHRVGRIGLGVYFGHGYYSPYLPYWGYGYGWGPSPRYYVSGDGASGGAFDLNVKPKKAEVFVDGIYVGTAGKLDGYPSYLWMERGDHELIFYLPGYETVVRQVTAIPGGVIDLSFEMIEGESRAPEEVSVRRGDEPAPAPLRSDAAEAYGTVVDARTEPGRLMVAIAPSDASVYLDGRFLGTGRELAGLHAGLMVDPGSHQIEVVRPGYASQSRDFSVEAGQEIGVEVNLEEQ